MGALSDKTVLLVTHQVDFLPVFDCILVSFYTSGGREVWDCPPPPLIMLLKNSLVAMLYSPSINGMSSRSF